MVNGQHLDLFIYKGSLELEIYSAVFTHTALQFASYSPIYTHIHHWEQLGLNVLLKDTSTCGEEVDNSRFGKTAIFLISQYPEIRSCIRRSDPSIHPCLSQEIRQSRKY